MNYYKAALGSKEIFVLADNETEAKSIAFFQFNYLLPDSIILDAKETKQHERRQYRRLYYTRLKRKMDFILIAMCIVVFFGLVLVAWINFISQGPHMSPWSSNH
jgi:hypothetical protein